MIPSLIPSPRQKIIMISVSVELVSKMISQLDEVSHVTTEFIPLYMDHQVTKLPILKYIVGYFSVEVGKVA